MNNLANTPELHLTRCCVIMVSGSSMLVGPGHRHSWPRLAWEDEQTPMTLSMRCCIPPVMTVLPPEMGSPPSIQ